MLVISRRLGEEFVIEPAGVRVKILALMANGGIRIGIEAPQSQTILRGELVGNYERLQREAEQSLSRRNQNDTGTQR